MEGGNQSVNRIFSALRQFRSGAGRNGRDTILIRSKSLSRGPLSSASLARKSSSSWKVWIARAPCRNGAASSVGPAL